MNSTLERYKNIRKYTEKICSPLANEDYLAQPTVFVSPPKWNLGHTSWFFETFVLQAYSAGYKIYNPDFAFIFNSYYNNLGDRVLRHRRGDLTRPTVKEVYQYRKHIDEAMTSFLEKTENQDALKFTELGLQHEQQHQELFWTDLKYTLSHNPLNVKYEGRLPFEEKEISGSPKFHLVTEGVYKIGFSGDGFCFDNELERHKVYLNEFTISENLVTNAEYIEFMEEGSYRDFNLWHDEGWKWVNDNEIVAPLYWKKKDGDWYSYKLDGLKKVNPEETVSHISFYEAFAFAEWKGMRLPTEQEWEIASAKVNWGQRWEWTNSAYLPYPGYKKESGAVGEYNGKFMVSQMVLRGASVATSPGHSRKTYRNFFHPWERWQFTGIRLAK